MSEPIFLATLTLLQDAQAINPQEPHIQSLTQEHSILECFWKLIEMYLIMDVVYFGPSSSERLGYLPNNAKG
jgi:hypothetical protein